MMLFYILTIITRCTLFVYITLKSAQKDENPSRVQTRLYICEGLGIVLFSFIVLLLFLVVVFSLRGGVLMEFFEALFGWFNFFYL